MVKEGVVDQALLKEALAGNGEAFLALVGDFDKEVYNLALRLLGNPGLAEEALQETFLRARKGLPHFRGESQIGTWLHRIAANVSYDLLKHMIKTRRHEVAFDPENEEGEEKWEEQWRDPDYRVDPEAIVLQLERRETLTRALERLTPEQRLTVLLHDELEMTVAEIAELSQVPLPTAKARLRRGRMALVSILDSFEEKVEPSGKTGTGKQRND